MRRALMLRALVRRALRRWALLSLAGGAFAVSACAADKTGYEGPFQAQVRKAIPAIEASFGHPFKTPPKLELRDRDQVREFLERQFNEQLTPLELAGVEQTYKLLGLIPDSLDLRQFLLDLLTEQVAGYYDPATKVLYVVEGGAPELTSVTISHELVHALQDQYYPLDSVRSLKGDNDRQMAMQAVIEGQAMYEQMSSMFAKSDFDVRLPSAWEQVREMIRTGQASMPRFADAPMLIQETLLFPYLHGAEFARQFKLARPGELLFSPIASSTEQILHPHKYLDPIPDLPTRVTLSAPRNGSLIHEDNLGEFETRLFLRHHLNNATLAARGAAGWDGDRYQVVNTRAGPGIGWLTIWDSAAEATEFRDLMERVVERRYGVAPGSGGTSVGAARQWTASGRRLTLTAVTVAGRPAVVFEDLPIGAAAGTIDLRGVTLRED